MPPITIEAIDQKQSELSKMIQQLKEQFQTKTIRIEGRTIELQPGESYAGAKLDDDGQYLHDVIVLAARSEDTYTFDGAQQWAKAAGGDAPSPEEFALIKANCPGLITRWTWTNKTHENDASFAWFFHSYGLTSYDRKSAEGGALAVRRS